MTLYFDPKVTDAEIAAEAPVLMARTQEFDPQSVRAHLLERGLPSGDFVRLLYRPFDTRWLYWHPETKLVERRREDFRPHIHPGNTVLAVVRQNRKGFTEPLVTSVFPSHHLIERGANYFPLYLTESLLGRTTRRPNLSDAAAAYLATLKATPEDLFYHTLAILHAPAYRKENAGALRQDWPRVPLAESKKALLASGELGRQVAALLDTEQPVPGVTEGKPRPELRSIAILARIDGKQLDDAVDLDVTAGWGHAGKDGVTMPGKGKIEQHENAYDIYLNDVAFWKNVPVGVWDYTIGGYQVMKKWLSYREKTLLGRGLTLEEVQEVTSMARRIAALLMLQPALDANYAAVKSATHQWEH
jgi:hypothetical protein